MDARSEGTKWTLACTIGCRREEDAASATLTLQVSQYQELGEWAIYVIAPGLGDGVGCGV